MEKIGNTEFITYFGTRDFRISNESWRTFAGELSSETNRFTNSIGTTGVGITRVRSFYTLLVFANVASLTIRVNLKKKMVWDVLFRLRTLYAKLTVHSGPHPVIVSGLGTKPFKHLQIGFPSLLAMHMVPGPQGLGSQGSGFKTHLEEVVNTK